MAFELSLNKKSCFFQISGKKESKFSCLQFFLLKKNVGMILVEKKSLNDIGQNLCNFYMLSVSFI